MPRFLIAALTAASIAAFASPSLAQHHGGGGGHAGGWHGGGRGGGWHGGGWRGGCCGVGWGLYGGWPYWGWGWPYYWDYPYLAGDAPVIAGDAPVYQSAAPVPSAPAGAPAAQPMWYYCDNPAGYYPYVTACNSAWRPVPAAPPATAPR